MASSAADSHTWSSVFQVGIPFLGAFKTGQAKVLLIQGDERVNPIQQQLSHSCFA